MLSYVFSTCLMALLDQTFAYSAGAGSCVGGEVAVGSPHRSATTVFEGGLAELTYDLQIDGQSLILGPSPPVLETGKDYAIEVKGFLARFRGALIRVETSEDILVELTPNENAGVALACEGMDGVVGITHTSASVKQTLSGVLRVADATDDMLVDVTVVGTNNEAYSMFGYDRVVLRFVDQVDVLAPSATTTTSRPVGTITSIPTLTPLSALTDAPTQAPVGSPTTVPTKDPVEVATHLPTQNTVATLQPTTNPIAVTLTPSQTPVVNDSKAPSKAPVALPTTSADPQSPTEGKVEAHTIRGLELEFSNVTKVSVDETFTWEKVTEAWFEEFFVDSPVDTIVPGTMETKIFAQSYYLKENPDGYAYVIVYDQELRYRSTSGLGDDDQNSYTSLPFQNATKNGDYLASLARELDSFQRADSVEASVPQPSDDEDSERDGRGLSGGGIVAIVIVFFLIVITGACLYISKSDNMKGHLPDNIPDTFSFIGSQGSRKMDASQGSRKDVLSVRSALTKAASNKYTVYAPSGKLLLVLEVEDNGIAPVIKSIQDDSPLSGKIQVGDYLVALDEVDVCEMTAAQVSKLIANRRANTVRKLTLIAGGVVEENSESDESVHP